MSNLERSKASANAEHRGRRGGLLVRLGLAARIGFWILNAVFALWFAWMFLNGKLDGSSGGLNWRQALVGWLVLAVVLGLFSWLGRSMRA